LRLCGRPTDSNVWVQRVDGAPAFVKARLLGIEKRFRPGIRSPPWVRTDLGGLFLRSELVE